MKLKEQLVEMGIDEELAQKVIDEVVDGQYIPKARFNEINEELKQQRAAVTDRDKQLSELKSASGDNAALQQQIAQLQAKNTEQQQSYEKQLSEMKLNNAVELALSSANVRSNKAVMAMLDMENVKLDGDKLTGFDEQIKALKESDSYLFNTESKQQQKFTGFQPGASTAVPNAGAAGNEARLSEARKNNNQLEVIKIKQEAAEDGVFLL
ncbi:MAG: phage scaffolding protein [Clostridiales bacterium]|nr:phage scaffolding protein [Clostridiales bacterium]